MKRVYTGGTGGEMREREDDITILFKIVNMEWVIVVYNTDHLKDFRSSDKSNFKVCS